MNRRPASPTAVLTMTLLLHAVAMSNASATSPDSPVGVWKTFDDNTGKPRSHVQIWEKNGVLYGKIIQLIDPPEPDPVCDKCKGNQQNKPVIGLTIMQGLEKDGDEWNGGTILDPENGKTYRVLLQLENGGRSLKVRGYIGVSVLGRTQRWQRIR